MRNWIAGVFSLVLMGGVAEASDLQSRMYGEPDSATFDWSGPYAGGSIGYGWLRDVDYAFTPPLRSSGEDVIFGIHLGYLHQFGAFVIGTEGELTKLNINFEGFPIDAEDSAAAKIRGGIAIDRFLVTGHAGAVHASTNIGLNDWGLVFGGAIDYTITNNLVAGVSYDHLRFERFDGTLIDAELDLLRARVSFKF